VKKNEIRALTSRLELAKSMAPTAAGSVPPSPGTGQAELNRLKELVETQRRKIQRLTEEKNKAIATSTSAGGTFGGSLVASTAGPIHDFKQKEDEFVARNKQLKDHVGMLL
jgi:hypothetical protein